MTQHKNTALGEVELEETLREEYVEVDEVVEKAEYVEIDHSKYHSERITSGGQGTVFRYHNKHDGQDLAVKILDATKIGDISELDRIKQEAHLLYRLGDHPNIARHVHFEDEVLPGKIADTTLFYFYTEWIEGRTLKDEAQHQAKTSQELEDILDQIVSGLEHAHARNIVHRDINPKNVMLTPQGQVKIIDFGVAKQLDRATMTASLGQVFGTANYIAPEVLNGERASAASDYYSAAATLVALARGGDFDNAFVGPQELQNYVVERMSHLSAPLRERLMTYLDEDPTKRVWNGVVEPEVIMPEIIEPTIIETVRKPESIDEVVKGKGEILIKKVFATKSGSSIGLQIGNVFSLLPGSYMALQLPSGDKWMGLLALPACWATGMLAGYLVPKIVKHGSNPITGIKEFFSQESAKENGLEETLLGDYGATTIYTTAGAVVGTLVPILDEPKYWPVGLAIAGASFLLGTVTDFVDNHRSNRTYLETIKGFGRTLYNTITKPFRREYSWREVDTLIEFELPEGFTYVSKKYAQGVAKDARRTGEAKKVIELSDGKTKYQLTSKLYCQEHEPHYIKFPFGHKRIVVRNGDFLIPTPKIAFKAYRNHLKERLTNPIPR